MYLDHYGLSQPPFSITPNPAFFFDGSQRGDILDALLYAVTHGEGIVKVTGEVGSGKTMLCRMLESLLPPTVDVIYLVNPALGRDEVLYAIAGELGLDVRDKRNDEVIRLLQTVLIEKHVQGRRVVLLVEEAQAMPLDTLEEIRLFSNLETARSKLLQIVLFGQPELDENLALARMRQLKERITHSFKVPPLTPSDLPAFLMFRLRAAGYKGGEVFTPAAVKALSKVSSGIVRRISILADKALLAAFADNSITVEARHMKAAIRDSEFSGGARLRLVRRQALSIVGMLVLAAGAGALAAYLIVEGRGESEPVEFRANGQATTAPAMPTSPSSAVAPSEPGPTASPGEQQAAEQVRKTHHTIFARSKSWLDNEPSHHYTVQVGVLPAADEAAIARFIEQARQRLGQDRLFAFPTRAAAKELHYGIVFGSFPTRDEAVAVRAALVNMAGFRPRLRTVEGLHEEMVRSGTARSWPS